MKVTEQIRRVYEKRPYPFGDERALQSLSASSLPLAWIQAACGTAWRNFSPERILVAGCGDGSEAFTLSRRFPRSEIVAVDFSPRSIALAQRLQKRTPRLRNIRFLKADLTGPHFGAMVGGQFDFISCHGVLTYIPARRSVLRNFARCLKPDGALYLGVNGTAHVSESVRQALPTFGFEMAELDEGPYLRELLQLCDAVRETGRAGALAKHSSEYLASDVFSPLIQNLPLAEWTRSCRAAGLHLLAARAPVRAFRRIADQGLHPLLIPRSRTAVCELLELLSPATFHFLLFSKRPEVNPPWEQHDQLLEWSVVRTRLYGGAFPKAGPVRDRLRTFKLKSSPLNTLLEWRMQEWEIEILRLATGQESLRTVLGRIPLVIPAQNLREQLYLLYQLGVIDLLPGARRTAGPESKNAGPRVTAERTR